MSKLKLTTFLGCLLILVSCDKFPFLPDDYCEIFLGEWKWLGTSCPSSGSYVDADSVDYSISLTFDKNGKYCYFENNLLRVSSDYKFRFDHYYNGNRHYDFTLENEIHTNFAYIIYYDNKEILVTGEKNPDTCELYFEREQ